MSRQRLVMLTWWAAIAAGSVALGEVIYLAFKWWIGT